MSEDIKTTTTLDEANEAGFLGTKTDPEPNESYTVAGVTKDPDGPSAEEKSAAKTAAAADDAPVSPKRSKSDD